MSTLIKEDTNQKIDFAVNPETGEVYPICGEAAFNAHITV